MLALAYFTWPAHAQDGAQDPAPHERYHQYYQTWMQPGGVASCCNANEYADPGHTIHSYGDCEPTTATLRRGADGQLHWFARLPKWAIMVGWGDAEHGEVEVPDSRIIHKPNPSIEEAHLCWTPRGGVLCFVPPDTGG